MLFRSWVFEHNVLHHSHTGEDADPDLLERNAEGSLRRESVPLPLRYLQLSLLAVTWRASYYAPETLASLRRKRRPDGPLTRAERRLEKKLAPPPDRDPSLTRIAARLGSDGPAPPRVSAGSGDAR